MPKIRLAFNVIILFFSCSLASAQTFMGIEQSKSLKLQKYQAPATSIKSMSSDDFKGTVGSMGEQTKATISNDINKKLLPPPAPFSKAPAVATPNQQTTSDTTSTMVSTPPAQPSTSTPTTTTPNYSNFNNSVTAPPTTNMAPTTTAPANSTPVYSGFQGTGNNNANSPAPAQRSGTQNAPAKSAGWNINY